MYFLQSHRKKTKMDAKQNSQQIHPKQYILFDTNIVQYATDKNSGISFINYLIELGKREFGFAISDITIYELLRGAYVNKKKDMLSVLSLFPRYFITEKVLVASAELETLYNLDKTPKADDGDKFIGATAILTGSLILTANSRDYPTPFFIEQERKIISYLYNGRNKSIPICLLSPDINVIKTKFLEIPNQ